jgi:two-component sensor histidine kinase
LLHTTPEQMIGKRRHEFMPKEDADWHEANDRKAIEVGHALEFEESSELPGRSITWLTAKFPLLDAQGRIYAVAGISTDITARKQAEEALKASIQEKEVLLKEIHHRVKNNLQVISSLVSLQADSLTDERIRDELNDVRDRVRSMALIHEKLYQTGDLAQLDFADYATSLMRTLWRSHSALAKNARLNLAVEPVLLSIDTAVPCGLILNELAGNALKHAFPNNSSGEVEVGFAIDPATKMICLRVRDNGVGLPAGFDWSQSEGLGLQLVKILAGQLSGTVETEPGPGTEFKIIFPLKENEHG